VRLADLTTLRVGGDAPAFIHATTEPQLIAAVQQADHQGEPVLVIGGGSNLLIADEAYPGLVVHADVRGVAVQELGELVFITAACGEPWDAFVESCLASGMNGLEALSGIPGTVGATPIQNVGAYGVEISSRIATVRVWDRQQQILRDLSPQECRFSYRHSAFKDAPGHWIVLAVTFALARTGMSRIAYQQLADVLGLNVGDTAFAAEIREAVLHLRHEKGMLLEVADHDTWSAGSFFTNPMVTQAFAAGLPSDCPRYPAGGQVKLSAAWLIEHAGMHRGFALNERASISTKHALAITNRGTATAGDLIALAREVRARVQRQFGIILQPEVRLIGCSLD
ncbi:MAG: UDP-N-acetylmuramate dehydrogenase, partial [Candidatus Nanopelagicales bacterium]